MKSTFPILSLAMMANLLLSASAATTTRVPAANTVTAKLVVATTAKAVTPTSAVDAGWGKNKSNSKVPVATPRLLSYHERRSEPSDAIEIAASEPETAAEDRGHGGRPRRYPRPHRRSEPSATIEIAEIKPDTASADHGGWIRPPHGHKRRSEFSDGAETNLAEDDVAPETSGRRKCHLHSGTGAKHCSHKRSTESIDETPEVAISSSENQGSEDEIASGNMYCHKDSDGVRWCHKRKRSAESANEKSETAVSSVESLNTAGEDASGDADVTVCHRHKGNRRHCLRKGSPEAMREDPKTIEPLSVEKRSIDTLNIADNIVSSTETEIARANKDLNINIAFPPPGAIKPLQDLCNKWGVCITGLAKRSVESIDSSNVNADRARSIQFGQDITETHSVSTYPKDSTYPVDNYKSAESYYTKRSLDSIAESNWKEGHSYTEDANYPVESPTYYVKSNINASAASGSDAAADTKDFSNVAIGNGCKITNLGICCGRGC